MNISVLCGLLEDVCKTFVLSYKMQRKESLHDVALPLSWLRGRTYDKSLRTKDGIYILFNMLLPAVSVLLEQLYTGIGAGTTICFLSISRQLIAVTDYLTYLPVGAVDDKDRGRMPTQVRNAFIARMYVFASPTKCSNMTYPS